MIGLSSRQRVEPRHAHQLRLAVDLGRARSALAGLAVPAAREVGRLLGLNRVHRVEHDHAFAGFGLVVLELPLRRSGRARVGTSSMAMAIVYFSMRWGPTPSADGTQRARSHGFVASDYLFSSMTCQLGRHRGIGTRCMVIAPCVLLNHEVERGELLRLVRDSRRGSARRGFPCARRRPCAMASDTVRRLWRSIAVCQPLLYSRLPVDAGARPRARAGPCSFSWRLAHLGFLADDADQVLHHVLQVVLDGVGVLAGRAALERRQRPRGGRVDLRLVDRRRAVLLGERRGVLAGALAEDDQVRERVAAEAVGAVQPGRRFAGREQARAAWTSACRRPPGSRPSCSASSDRLPSASS